MAKLNREDPVKTSKGEANLKWKKKFVHVENVVDCKHCIYTRRELSIPVDTFKIKKKDGSDRTVTTIRIIRGSEDDVIGWVS